MSEMTPDADAAVVAQMERAKQHSRRANVRIPIRISTIDPEKDPESGKLYFFTSEEFSANVSRGGAFVPTPERIDPGQRLLVEIDIPNGSSVQAIGRVVWKQISAGQSGASPRKRSGIGIQFTNGRPDLLNELDRYINRVALRRSKAPELGSTTQPST